VHRYRVSGYSASRHNLALHCNRGEIVPLLEYLAGRASGRYQASHPSLYRRSKEKRIYEFGYATGAADSVGDTFRPAGLQGQYDHQQLSPSSSSSTIHDQPPDVLPYPTDQSQSAHTADDYGTLSEETRLKIEELKKRIYRYAQYHPNPVAVINCIIYYCNNGDNTLLDEKLEQLRSIDAISRY
jgi:hypothetical protein